MLFHSYEEETRNLELVLDLQIYWKKNAEYLIFYQDNKCVNKDRYIFIIYFKRIIHNTSYQQIACNIKASSKRIKKKIVPGFSYFF